MVVKEYIHLLFFFLLILFRSRKLRKTNYLVFDFSHSVQTSKYSENEDNSSDEEKTSEIYLDSKKEGLIN